MTPIPTDQPSLSFLDTLSLDDLDGDLRLLAGTFGLDVARYFIACWSGTQIYIPAPGSSSATLEEIETALGPNVRDDLQAAWGGCFLYIPARRRLKVQWLRDRIPVEYDGRNAGRLAARYGVSRRFVDRVVREGDPEDVSD
jgi:Mor family transcriptional regulator